MDITALAEATSTEDDRIVPDSTTAKEAPLSSLSNGALSQATNEDNKFQKAISAWRSKPGTIASAM